MSSPLAPTVTAWRSAASAKGHLQSSWSPVPNLRGSRISSGSSSVCSPRSTRPASMTAPGRPQPRRASRSCAATTRLLPLAASTTSLPISMRSSPRPGSAVRTSWSAHRWRAHRGPVRQDPPRLRGCAGPARRRCAQPQPGRGRTRGRRAEQHRARRLVRSPRGTLGLGDAHRELPGPRRRARRGETLDQSFWLALSPTSKQIIFAAATTSTRTTPRASPPQCSRFSAVDPRHEVGTDGRARCPDGGSGAPHVERRCQRTARPATGPKPPIEKTRELGPAGHPHAELAAAGENEHALA